MRKRELIVWPVLLFFFYITYHYYAFYKNDFQTIFAYVPMSFTVNQYDSIQQFHPYYPVYKLAKEEKPNNVIYLRTKTVKESRESLQELTIMINYFFYPHVIPQYSLKTLSASRLRQGTIIISDFPLAMLPAYKDKVEPIPFVKKNLFRINRWPEDIYYIFKVKHSL